MYWIGYLVADYTVRLFSIGIYHYFRVITASLYFDIGKTASFYEI